MTKEQRIRLFTDQFEVFLKARKRQIDDAFKLLLAEIDIDNFYYRPAIETIKRFITNLENYKKFVKTDKNADMLTVELKGQRKIIENLMKVHYHGS